MPNSHTKKIKVFRNHLASDMPPADISLLLPTRGRPALAQRFLQSVLDTTSTPERVEVVLYIDDDDFASQALDCAGLRLIRIIGPSESMGFYNTCCKNHANGHILVLVNDDMVIRSPGWDQKLIETEADFPDGIFLAYPNDQNKGKALCTFPILSRRGCDRLIDPYPEAYLGAFIDLHLFDIFKRLQYAGEDRLRYLPEVIFEHLHYRTGKSAVDETYRRRDRFGDDLAFLRLRPFRAASAKRLLDAIRSKTCDAGAPAEIPQPTRNYSLIYVTTVVLFDGGLPFFLRLKRWIWFCGRFLASKGLLGPIGR